MRLLIAAYLAALAALLGVAAAGAVVIFRDSRPDDAIESAADEHGFNFLTWELRHFPEKWLYKIGHAFDGGASQEEDNDVLLKYFLLVAELRRLEEEEPGSPDIPRLEAERADSENRVEDILEGRITAILEDEALAMAPPIFSDLGVVFPPADFELESPTRVLAVSPRDRIELDHDYLLTPGLSQETALAIEEDVEADNTGKEGVSAIVIATGGVATYPSVVSFRMPSASLIDTVFHEWVHQYLAFFPLGSNYYSGSKLRTINESVASLAGRELAELYFERYGELQAPAPSATPAAASPSPTPQAEEFDFTAEMRALRVEVEEMLADGLVTEAEALMVEKRDEFEAKGRYIRRLNQAYFAFYGFYGDSPASVDPIGPKVETLLEAAGSVGEFVRLASTIDSEAGLDRLLAGP